MAALKYQLRIVNHREKGLRLKRLLLLLSIVILLKPSLHRSIFFPLSRLAGREDLETSMYPHQSHTRPYKRPHAHNRNEASSSTSRPIPQSAYIQAYEAQLVYGQQSRAEDLYSKGGRGLMKWQGRDEDGEIWADR